MANPNQKKKIELTLRMDENTVRRLEWIEFKRRDLKFRNDALMEAVSQWLSKNEAIYGTSPEQLTRSKGKQA